MALDRMQDARAKFRRLGWQTDPIIGGFKVRLPYSNTPYFDEQYVRRTCEGLHLRFARGFMGDPVYALVTRRR